MLIKFIVQVVKITLGVLLAMIVIKAFSQFAPFKMTSHETDAQLEISYVDFISIILTAISLLLATLGFVLAILAFIGWNAIGNRVTKHSEEYLRKSVDEGGQLHRLVKSEVKEIMYGDIVGLENTSDQEADENS